MGPQNARHGRRSIAALLLGVSKTLYAATRSSGVGHDAARACGLGTVVADVAQAFGNGRDRIAVFEQRHKPTCAENLLAFAVLSKNETLTFKLVGSFTKTPQTFEGTLQK